MSRRIKRVFRDRPLTPEESSRDDAIRFAVQSEFPPATTMRSSRLSLLSETLRRAIHKRHSSAVSASQQIDPQVIGLAQCHGLESVLPLVCDLTERLFPMAQAVYIELVADDEQPNQQTIVFKVRGLDIEPQLGAELHWQWASELHQLCPGPGRALFGLELCWTD